MGTLPAFKTSGNSYLDLKKVITSEILAWGGHKGKLIYQLEQVAGITTIDGKQVYNNINLLGQTSDFNNPTMKLMEMYGVDEEGKTSLNEVETQNTLDQFSMLFRYSNLFDQEGWSNYLKILSGLLANTTSMIITSSPVAYTAPEGAPIYSNGFGVTNGTTDNVYANYHNLAEAEVDWIIGTDSQSANPTRLRNHFTIEFYNGATNVTSQFAYTEQQAVLCMIFMEGTNAFQNLVQQSSDELIGTLYYKNQAEEWSTSMNVSYMESRYDAYTLPNEGVNSNPNSTEERVPGASDVIFFPFYWANIWDSVRLLGASPEFALKLEEETNGLFIALGSTGYAAMTVEGLRKADVGTFGFWVSQYMTIHIHQQQPTGIKAVIVGIMDAFLTFIDAVTGLFLQIPILKQTTQLIISIIGRIFAVEGDTARQIFNAIILAVILIIVSYYVAPLISSSFSTLTSTVVVETGLSVGLSAGISTMITYSSNALSIYNAAMNAKAIGDAQEYAKDKTERDARMRKYKEKSAVQKAFMGTLGTVKQNESTNYLMYDAMFNPYDNHPQAIPPEELPMEFDNF